MKEPKAKRTLKFKMKDGSVRELEIEKVTSVNANVPFIFHIDLLKNGKARLTYADAFEIDNLESVEIIRNQEQER